MKVKDGHSRGITSMKFVKKRNIDSELVEGHLATQNQVTAPKSKQPTSTGPRTPEADGGDSNPLRL